MLHQRIENRVEAKKCERKEFQEQLNRTSKASSTVASITPGMFLGRNCVVDPGIAVADVIICKIDRCVLLYINKLYPSSVYLLSMTWLPEFCDLNVLLEHLEECFISKLVSSNNIVKVVS